MPKVEANKIEIYYELHGPKDADVLVLSNGVFMSTASWAFQTPVLSQHYRLLLYDCRGMWRSEHPPGPYSMELHADDLAALLDALGIERAHIGGTSYGAEISMVFALKYPERTRSLIVTSAVSHIDPLLKGMIDTWIAAARAHDPEMFFHVVYPLTFSEAWIAANQEALDLALERFLLLIPRVWHSVWKTIWRIAVASTPGCAGRIAPPSTSAPGVRNETRRCLFPRITVLARKLSASHQCRNSLWVNSAKMEYLSTISQLFLPGRT